MNPPPISQPMPHSPSDLPPYYPPLLLRSGLIHTLYTALIHGRNWQALTPYAQPPYQEQIIQGGQNIPLWAWVGSPKSQVSPGTVIATYGITGELTNQWYLQIFGRKAWDRGYGVILFDWRGHGKTGELCPTLTSDGIYEGGDFLAIAEQAAGLGCPPPYWLVGYSLGGQLALWGLHAAETENNADIAGVAVICPSLDSLRSLKYLVKTPWGRAIERSITKQLKILARHLYAYHPQALDLEAIQRANSIWEFDQELVIPRLGFESVAAYYQASSPFRFLDQLKRPVYILYAADDPLFDPSIIPDLKQICHHNPALHLHLTRYGGHVGYLSDNREQKRWGDPDGWWAWNRVLAWFNGQSSKR
ncbi:YheT family hydrolase [Synechococcus sp. PCC 6312]|uniref:YheT family hydrolase n=1 Tax=Synechococcus sp. (strain ATCC 27167 / PCC 6312) TaxID=195253 RepID=UPI0020A07DE1|nr:alpha/beta fold hydrolase [Synechococcus sp. PCC 6312]